MKEAAIISWETKSRNSRNGEGIRCHQILFPDTNFLQLSLPSKLSTTFQNSPSNRGPKAEPRKNTSNPGCNRSFYNLLSYNKENTGYCRKSLGIHQTSLNAVAIRLFLKGW